MSARSETERQDALIAAALLSLLRRTHTLADLAAQGSDGREVAARIARRVLAEDRRRLEQVAGEDHP